VKLQEEHWSPVIQWAKEELKIEVKTFDSVMIGSQPQASKEALRKILAELDQWQLAGASSPSALRYSLTHFQGLERAVYTTKSLLTSLALIKGRINVEQAAESAHVEVNSQIQKWGQVEDCEISRFTDLNLR
jgi:ATP synthase mitochondrial F1 complex assembly factor 2